MLLASSVTTKKLPGNVGTCAHVVPTLHLLSSYAIASLFSITTNKDKDRITGKKNNYISPISSKVFPTTIWNMIPNLNTCNY